MSGKYSAVLFSGGLDSAVLLAEAARDGRVRALYVSVGFAWEREERAAIARLLAAPPFAGAIDPLVDLRFDMRDVFPPSHWAVRGEAPAFDTPDEDVYLHGRNLTLLSKAAIYMARHATSDAAGPPDVTRILLGPLAGNPFPDATLEFFDTMARALSLGLATPIAIEAPYRSLHKHDVIRRGIELGVPLELTLSCMQPEGGMHCGRCSKCRERRDAFREAGVEDPTQYRRAPIR
ncbi:MAG TPA: 7-cyano-7-deazaguanine synthase [Vicinamibacterales bacterium]|jgi:7-cyano-7-deazaguanine synthase|nr:7-cyano-7-deazaguanine synthase [Vicinamibacterales bacterium]